MDLSNSFCLVLKVMLETICGMSVSQPKKVVPVQIFYLQSDVSDLSRMVDHITTFLNENKDSADFRIFCQGETVDVHLFILGATLVFVLISLSCLFKGLRSLTQSTQQRNQVWK